MKTFLNLLRYRQWIKNLFVLAPLFFSFHFDYYNIAKVVIGFILFCSISSSVYIFNDILDIEEDRKHPIKRHRPLASGAVSKRKAIFIMLLLCLFSLSISFYLNLKFFLILSTYLLTNVFYSLKLKHIPIIDITIIATGFVLRVFAGAVLIDVEPSMWIILDTFLLALFIALAKRRDDVILYQRGVKARKSIDGYNLDMINAGMVVMACVAIVCYIMYTVSFQTLEKYHSSKLYLTSLFVIVGFLRYLQITFVEENSGSPTEIILRDRFLQAVVLGWLVSFYLIVRLKL